LTVSLQRSRSLILALPSMEKMCEFARNRLAAFNSEWPERLSVLHAARRPGRKLQSTNAHCMSGMRSLVARISWAM